MKSVQVFEGDGVAEHLPPPVIVPCHYLKFNSVGSPRSPWLWLSGWSDRQATFSSQESDAVPIPLDWSEPIGGLPARSMLDCSVYCIVHGTCTKEALDRWPQRSSLQTKPDRRANACWAEGRSSAVTMVLGFLLACCIKGILWPLRKMRR